MLYNCQIFSAEEFKMLKAIRIHETDKVKVTEKFLFTKLYNQALWHNEDLSLTNTLGRLEKNIIKKIIKDKNKVFKK